jgi:hypothetical protein
MGRIDKEVVREFGCALLAFILLWILAIGILVI